MSEVEQGTTQNSSLTLAYPRETKSCYKFSLIHAEMCANVEYIVSCEIS